MRAGMSGIATIKEQAGRVIAIAVISMLVASASLAQEKAGYSDLPNFHKVNEQLYRGGQPKSGGVKKLAELGIKTIVNLRGSDETTRAEEAEARAAGLAYFNIPLPGFSRPTHAQVARVMAIIENEGNGPVFIHCRRGSDRTGTVVAIYRISQHNWTASQAMNEAKRLGLSWFEFGMKDYISDYYRDRNADNQKSFENGEPGDN